MGLETKQTTTQDPVCGMTVDEKSAAGSSTYKGKQYFFCCPGCQKQFDQQPETYLRNVASFAVVNNENCGCGCGVMSHQCRMLCRLTHPRAILRHRKLSL